MSKTEKTNKDIEPTLAEQSLRFDEVWGDLIRKNNRTVIVDIELNKFTIHQTKKGILEYYPVTNKVYIVKTGKWSDDGFATVIKSITK